MLFAFLKQELLLQVHAVCIVPMHRQMNAAQVPVVNRSNQPVHVTADLRGGEAFSGPKDITVGPGQTAAYPLTFRAPWIGDYVGNLDLNFPATGVWVQLFGPTFSNPAWKATAAAATAA